MATLHLSLFYLTSISKQILIYYTYACTLSHSSSLFRKYPSGSNGRRYTLCVCVCIHVFFMLYLGSNAELSFYIVKGHQRDYTAFVESTFFCGVSYSDILCFIVP